MDVLVTGGAGYKGSMLTQALLEEGHDVTVVDNFMFGCDPLFHLVHHPNLEVRRTDIRNPDLSYLEGKDAIFHLAAISGYPACEANPNSAQLINVEATRRITRELDDDQLLIFASTTSLYGEHGTVCDEKTPVEPESLYGLTKRKAEKIVLERDNSIALRWATIFGTSPRMREGLLVNDFVDKAMNDGSLVLYSPESERTFLHIRDCIRGYLFALEHADEMTGGIWNMGHEDLNYSKQAIADRIKEHVDYKVLTADMPSKDKRNFYVSFEKARSLGFDYEHTLEEGIEELVKLYRFYDPNSFVKPI